MYDIYTCMIQNRKMIHIFFGCISCCRTTEHGSYYQALAFIEVSHTQIKHILCTFYITYLYIYLYLVIAQQVSKNIRFGRFVLDQ